MQERNVAFTVKTVVPALFMIILMWLVFWIEVRFHIELSVYGLYPQELSGLLGVLTSPLLHSSFSHLWSNTVPIFVLTTMLFYFYEDIGWKTFILGWLLTGSLAWIIARPSYHIGASGIVYFLFGFLFFKGLWTRYYRLVASSFIVCFLYGGLVWYILPIKAGMSWESHLAGLLVGILLSIIVKFKPRNKTIYSWQQPDYNEQDDVFMQHFDEDGNFVEKLQEEE